MSAHGHTSAIIGDRAHPVRNRLCLSDDRLVVERIEGLAGGKKTPPRRWGGVSKKTMPHAPRLAKESS
jgi:hypothetical protein